MSQVNRITPVRPMMGMASARFFSSAIQTDSTDEEEGAADSTEKKGRFFKFLETAETLDKKIKDSPAEAKRVTKEGEAEEEEVQMMFDADEIEISFADQAAERAIDIDLIDPVQELEQSLEGKQPIRSQQDLENLKLIQEAKQKFNVKFFQNFAYEGPLASALAQRDLESYLVKLSPEDQQMLVLSLINSAYELNEIIPNAELVFFKMFTSPLSTKAQRKMGDGDDLLAGNLFSNTGFKMPKQAYMSLLHSVALRPKKKHYKKIIQYMVLNESPAELDSDLINLVTEIGIDQKYPVLLGSTIKYLLQNNYKVSESTFQNFVMFLERCKGYEEDAIRFLLLSSETDYIQVNYKMVKPLFLRAMQYKSAQDVLKLFEQFRKNLKINRAGKSMSQGDKAAALKNLKKEFYDGLMEDLLKR